MKSLKCLLFLWSLRGSHGFLPCLSTRGFCILDRTTAIRTTTSGSSSLFSSHEEEQQPWNDFRPDSSLPGRQSKGDLYSNEELQNLLNLHQTLEENGGFAAKDDDDDDEEEDGPISLGLHDMVLQTLEDITVNSTAAEKEAPVNDNSSSSSLLYSLTDTERRKLRNIRAIASDVDGTLISSDQTVHPITQAAIQRALHEVQSPDKKLQHFFVATGKTRKALQSLGPDLGPLLQKCAGVFVQGLYCVNAQGQVIYEEKLGQDEADTVIEFAHKQGLSVFAYNGDQIFTTRQSNPQHIRDVHEVWGEPRPTVVDSLVGYEPRYHKCLLWSDDIHTINTEIRPQLEEIAVSHKGSVTQAIPTMLEFLPRGASKAKGVRKLCEYLGIEMDQELLAIGDAENDVEFLREAAFGVAVGNGVPKVKQVADISLSETNDDGGAGIAITWLGLGDGI
jgi:Cof subfamily protein (haloacid dehalogenase superfamily)